MNSPTVVVPADLVLVGYISGAYGLGGWVRIKPYASDGAALLSAKTWWMDKPELCDVHMMQAKLHSGDVVAKLMGIVDREAAERLRGAGLYISRGHFPPLANDEFYWVDLIGLTVENIDGISLGEVTDLLDNGAHPILRIKPFNADDNKSLKTKELLVPFVDHYIKTVDQSGRKIVVDWGVDY